jgi:hypothetical protein
MRGRLKKIDDKWVVEYSGVSYSGGNPKQLGSYTKKVEKKTLPLHSNFVTMTDYVWVKGVKVYDGDKVTFTEVLVNPMGREVDPNDLGQNHSKCIWCAKLVEGKDEQKQHLIDMMKSDEELGLYDESREIKVEDIFNDEKREKVKQVIHQHKVLKGLSLVNPAHLEMTSNGHGEFPDGYKLTEKGIQYIIEQLNKE